ncbi:MAG: hypothetical protein L0K86_14505 [Actinomycetia bacterium]|nr:hypothetical protein [Actinomycetes bacterium]
MLVLVDLVLQPYERPFRVVVGLDRLPEVARPASEEVRAGVRDSAVRAARQMLDVAALTALPGGMGWTLEATHPTIHPTRRVAP